jgi:hypothetical protein
MRIGSLLAVVSAILLHAGFLLFGGALIPDAQANESSLAEVALLDESVEDDEKRRRN